MMHRRLVSEVEGGSGSKANDNMVDNHHLTDNNLTNDFLQ